MSVLTDFFLCVCSKDQAELDPADLEDVEDVEEEETGEDVNSKGKARHYPPRKRLGLLNVNVCSHRGFDFN